MHVDYRSLADLRYHIRGFLAVREAAARAAGLEPQQYLVLLQIKGLAGEAPATVGALAHRLHIKHHSAVELVDRLCARGLVARRRATDDRRQVIVQMRPAGRAVLQRLATHSLAELQNVGPALIQVLSRLTAGTGARRRPTPAARRAESARRRPGSTPLRAARRSSLTAVRRPTVKGGSR